MLITESQLSLNRGIDSFALLGSMNYLTEAESRFDAAMVPVVENKTVNGHLIRLEDMVSFAESNGIEDLGYALTLVCEASEVDPQTIAFSVQEDTIIADSEIADLAKSIMNEGVQVVAVPINPNLPGCLAADLAIDNLIATGESTLLDALVNDDFDTFFAEASKADREDASENLAFNAKTDYETMKSTAEKAHEQNAEIAKNTQGKLETIWQKLKNGVGITRDWLAQILGWLHKKAQFIQAEMVKVAPNKRSIWQKIKAAVSKAIEAVTRKLHNFVQANRGNLEKYDLKTGQVAKEK